MPTITATELARHTRQILDQVAQRRETIVVERNQTVIARLVPAEPMMRAAEALADLPVSLGAEDAARWLRDSREGFEDGVRDPWA
ncbi:MULTISPECIES: type II toxin-antitoxin system Phd/YefM family antitoxin [Burkholderia]|uniref:Antitoxin Phd YefM, type II toxin-antitoxin system family protein n=1 Tax=Burkholderia cepacia TaxID=292 RepID=A0AA89CMA4_BURCE|nr:MULTISPECIES: type II toxin-antitoxin system Phd/YefM family antitoxin [Burkholderia]AOI80841.1 antitoxin of toxin-antitoxin stability system [Burkholderia sp. NRF60-BP8]KGC06613.1 antitoxin Phd YefM, type II toxin-antitoxin system family protein [Burkholderia cepacia]KVA06426.1 antitoxin of toxin-antitoxin stability system [Burkholderia sp. NRF60-BP8]KVL13136.1 antitoxin of toxin-antitoxin stability system [Burkholderia sp. MSMB1826]KWE53186.1 antitoxin of toxin-antitoxin stability system 